jgi:hypothetical protein
MALFLTTAGLCLWVFSLAKNPGWTLLIGPLAILIPDGRVEAEVA